MATVKEFNKTASDISEDFIDDLEGRRAELIEMLDGVNQVIDSLRRNVAPETIEPDGDDDGDDENGEGGDTVELTGKAAEVREQVVQVLDGSEPLTQRELYERLGVHQSLMSFVMRQMRQNGEVRIVEPRRGPHPSKYALSQNGAVPVTG